GSHVVITHDPDTCGFLIWDFGFLVLVPPIGGIGSCSFNQRFPNFHFRISSSCFVLRNLMLRWIPFHLVRLIAECLNIFLKLSSVIASHSRVDKFSTSGMGMNSGSSLGLLKRFQGQTSWQISQPN